MGRFHLKYIMWRSISTIILPVLVLVLAYLWRGDLNWFSVLRRHRIRDSATSWDVELVQQALAAAVGPANHRRIAVGVNGNIDLIAPAVAVFKALDLENPTVQPVGALPASVASLIDLRRLGALSFAHGSAVERTVDTPKLFAEMVDAVRGDEGHHAHIGGNAALIAENLVPNATVMLGAMVGDGLKGLLDSRIKLCRGCSAKNDEFHLILEYGKDETWGALVALRANRVIVSHDIANTYFHALSPFFDQIPNFSPDLIVISGLHLLTPLSDDIAEELLDRVVSRMKALPACTPVHLELASIGKTSLIRSILEKVLPAVDSIGLNEQELHALFQVAAGMDKKAVPAVDPSMPAVIDMISAIFEFMPAYSKLSRVHFHSLQFHLVAAVPEKWDETASRSAVSHGSWTTTSNACGFDRVGIHLNPEFEHEGKNFKFTSRKPFVTWTSPHKSTGSLRWMIALVLICEQPHRTVGLGDSISAAGLIHAQHICSVS